MLTDAILARLMAKVSYPESGCWTWTGATSRGYAQARFDGRTQQVHRLLYEHHIGPIPVGLTLDHTCHTRDLTCDKGDDCPHRRCVNPQHMAPMTQRANTLRGRGHPAKNVVKNKCPQDHAYEGANLYVDKTGRRHCKKCQRENARRSYQKTDGAAYMRAWRAARKAAQ